MGLEEHDGAVARALEHAAFDGKFFRGIAGRAHRHGSRFQSRHKRLVVRQDGYLPCCGRKSHGHSGTVEARLSDARYGEMKGVSHSKFSILNFQFSINDQ